MAGKLKLGQTTNAAVLLRKEWLATSCGVQLAVLQQQTSACAKAKRK
jgi:hypothetical protein